MKITIESNNSPHTPLYTIEVSEYEFTAKERYPNQFKHEVIKILQRILRGHMELVK